MTEPLSDKSPRCDNRYRLTMQREEPFEVTYRCGRSAGHDGACAADDGQPFVVPPIAAAPSAVPTPRTDAIALRDHRNDSGERVAKKVMMDEAFQAACQRYAHSNGSSEAIAAAALRAAHNNAAPQVPAMVTSGAEGEIAAQSGVCEVATKYPVTAPAVAALECVVVPLERDEIEWIREHMVLDPCEIPCNTPEVPTCVCEQRINKVCDMALAAAPSDQEQTGR